jgi:hypothetical protein
VLALAQSLGERPGVWLVIAALGLYHGLNPSMGWLFAVSAGMHARRKAAVLAALPPIALGHLLAMAAALLPFAILGMYLDRLREIQVLAGLLIAGFGFYKLVRVRHPRWLARVSPSHLVLWSFLMATAHGAGLMLVPTVLGLCTSPVSAEGAAAHAEHAGSLAGLGAAPAEVALTAALLHTATMLAAGGAIAWLVYRHIGLSALRRSWINFDLLWALMLVAMGGYAIVAA